MWALYAQVLCTDGIVTFMYACLLLALYNMLPYWLIVCAYMLCICNKCFLCMDVCFTIWNVYITMVIGTLQWHWAGEGMISIVVSHDLRSESIDFDSGDGLEITGHSAMVLRAETTKSPVVSLLSRVILRRWYWTGRSVGNDGGLYGHLWFPKTGH